MSLTLIQHPSDLHLFHAVVLTEYMEVVLVFFYFLRAYQYNLSICPPVSLIVKKVDSRFVQKNKDVSKDEPHVKVASLT